MATNNIGPFYLYFGQLIERQRKAIGATQAVIAKRIGQSRASIANIERGEQRICTHMLPILADALCMKRSDFYDAVHKAGESCKKKRDIIYV